MNPIYRFYLRKPSSAGNLLNPASVVEGLLQGGNIIGSTMFYAGTDYIPVTATFPYCIYPLSGSATGGIIAWYNSSKTLISQISVSALGPQFAPNGAAFARVSFPQSWEVATFAAFGDPDTFAPYGYTQRQAYPVYGDSAAISFSKESGEEFFRRGLDGNLTFLKDDFDWINGAAFDTRHTLQIQISYDGGDSWTDYWKGYFYKTDCEFQPGLIIVKPSVEDEYTKILAGIDKEFDLIKLAPGIESVTARKRPVLQLYVPGQSVIGCILAGMYWEQDAKTITSDNTLRQTYHFYKTKDVTQAILSTISGSNDVPDALVSNSTSITWDNVHLTTTRIALSIDYAGAVLQLEYWDVEIDTDNWQRWSRWRLTYDGNIWLSSAQQGSADIPPQFPFNPTLNGSGSTIEANIVTQSVYGRLVHDCDTIPGASVYDLPTDDITAENLNYHKVTPWDFPDMLAYSAVLSDTPTPYGKYDDTRYYAQPYFPGVDFMPIARSAWGRFSLWYTGWSGHDAIIEQNASKEFTFRDSYPLNAVISALLGQIDTEIRFDADSAFSAFFYGSNPIKQDGAIPHLIPKSNVIKGEYDQPAQKAPITLRRVLDMLRDCFRCYWFIEEGKLRIEHISYFMNGGSYGSLPGVGIDLTRRILPRNGKAWAFGQENYKYDKPSMPERYEFAWMDKQTDPFNGQPIEITSGFVSPGSIEKVSVTHFSADIDYILLNPSDISEDGFVLTMVVDGAIPEEAIYYDGKTFRLQNPYASFVYLQRFYLYDLPAPNYSIGGKGGIAAGVQRYKESEAVFPAMEDPDVLKLVKTAIGEGKIKKIDITLQGRTAKATLRYDTD